MMNAAPTTKHPLFTTDPLLLPLELAIARQVTPGEVLERAADDDNVDENGGLGWWRGERSDLNGGGAAVGLRQNQRRQRRRHQRQQQQQQQQGGGPMQLLNDAEVLATVMARYRSGRCYTKAGPNALLAVNPHRWLPDFDDDLRRRLGRADWPALLGCEGVLQPPQQSPAVNGRRRRRKARKGAKGGTAATAAGRKKAAPLLSTSGDGVLAAPVREADLLKRATSGGGADADGFHDASDVENDEESEAEDEEDEEDENEDEEDHEELPLPALPPHPYCEARQAVLRCCGGALGVGVGEGTPQLLVMLGEAGSGKSFLARMVVNFLTASKSWPDDPAPPPVAALGAAGLLLDQFGTRLASGR